MGQIKSKATTVSVVAASSGIFGLDWPGDGKIRRMLYWSNPCPIYDVTYIFKVFPRAAKTGPDPRYWTTFFWGNNGNFVWDGGGANTYYGAHPYPFDGHDKNTGQNWEISVYGRDIAPREPNNGAQVNPWGKWYTQAFRAIRVSTSVTRHEFYYDLPDTTKVITYEINDSTWAKKNPPYPAIVMGQTPDLNGPPPAQLADGRQSWGGYPGWEEFNGIIRGIQIYSGQLSVADIQAEIANPKSTANGQKYIWYLNINPKPDDISDKKGTGTANNPIWDSRGLPAKLWTG